MTYPASYYTEYMSCAISMLKKTLEQVVAKCADRPISILDYNEIGMGDKLVEVRLEEEAITMTCVFDKRNECVSIYFFPDTDDVLKSLISDLQNNGYLCIANTIIENDKCCYLRIRRSSTHKDQFLMFYIG